MFYIGEIAPEAVPGPDNPVYRLDSLALPYKERTEKDTHESKYQSITITIKPRVIDKMRRKPEDSNKLCIQPEEGSW
jgi:protein required for attachment to host cells